MKLRNLSLRTKLVGVFLGPTLVIVLLYGLLAYFSARQGLEDELGRRLKSVGQAVSAELSEGFDAEQIKRLNADKRRVRERLRERLETVRDATDVRRLFIFDDAYRNLVDTNPDARFGEQIYKLEADRFEIEQTFEEGTATTSVLFAGDDGRMYKSAYVPITLDGEVIAGLAVEASAEYFGLLREFASGLTVLGLVGVGLVILAGGLFSRALTRPVIRLVEAARRLGEGELEQPVVERAEEEEAEDDEPGDEIVFLARSFEEMRQNILHRDQQMKMMLSGIAHEVRNPLGGMELFCGLLREDLEKEGDDEKIKKVARIERELGYLDRVVDNFREFARESALERERFPAAEMLRELSDLLAGDVEAAGCSLECRAPDGLELTGDKQRLRRVVLNLVRNAYQACEQGAIEVVVEQIDSPSEPPKSTDADGWRRIMVRDDGPGIDDETLEEMFTPFYTTKEKGSGLGLPLSRQIVERHGGTLRVETAPGEGTVVVIELPFDEEIEESAPEVPDGWLG